MQLKADDGTPLEVKEAIVLDRDGEVIVEAPIPDPDFQGSGGFSAGRTFQLSGWWVPVLVVVILLTLSLGAVFFGAFLLIALLISVVKKVLRSLGI